MADILDAAQSTTPTPPPPVDPVVPAAPPPPPPIEPPPMPPPPPAAPEPPVTPSADSLIVPPSEPAAPEPTTTSVPPPAPPKRKSRLGVLIAGLVLLVITLPVAVFVINQQTELRSRAASYVYSCVATSTKCTGGTIVANSVCRDNKVTCVSPSPLCCRKTAPLIEGKACHTTASIPWSGKCTLDGNCRSNLAGIAWDYLSPDCQSNPPSNPQYGCCGINPSSNKDCITSGNQGKCKYSKDCALSMGLPHDGCPNLGEQCCYVPNQPAQYTCSASSCTGTIVPVDTCKSNGITCPTLGVCCRIYGGGTGGSTGTSGAGGSTGTSGAGGSTGTSGGTSAARYICVAPNGACIGAIKPNTVCRDNGITCVSPTNLCCDKQATSGSTGTSGGGGSTGTSGAGGSTGTSGPVCIPTPAQKIGCTKTTPPGSDGCIKYTCPLGDTNKDGNCDLRDTQASQQNYDGAGCPDASCGSDCCQIEYTNHGKFIADTCGNTVTSTDYYMMCKELKLNCSTSTPTTTTAPQCTNLVALSYKDEHVLTEAELSALQIGDTVVFALAPGGGATKARFRVNSTNDADWVEIIKKNTNGQYVFMWVLGDNVTSYTIEAEWFDGTNWY